MHLIYSVLLAREKTFATLSCFPAHKRLMKMVLLLTEGQHVVRRMVISLFILIPVIVRERCTVR